MTLSGAARPFSSLLGFLWFFVYFVFVHWVFFFFFWLHSTADGTSVLQRGIELVPPALEAQNLNQWSIREVPCLAF